MAIVSDRAHSAVSRPFCAANATAERGAPPANGPLKWYYRYRIIATKKAVLSIPLNGPNVAPARFQRHRPPSANFAQLWFEHLALGMIGFDDFEPVNDTWGRAAGDTLRQEFPGAVKDGCAPRVISSDWAATSSSSSWRIWTKAVLSSSSDHLIQSERPTLTRVEHGLWPRRSIESLRAGESRPQRFFPERRAVLVRRFGDACRSIRADCVRQRRHQHQ